MDSSGEKRTVTLQSNPLLIKTVIHGVFEYLPLEFLKQCRFVCQDWNSVSIQILNMQQSKIKLDSKEQITNFLEFYKDYDTQAFPFTTFHFKFTHGEWNTEELNQLKDVFNTLRDNIITLTFEESGMRNRVNLTAFIEIATSLVRLTISSCNSRIELNALVKVKYISLNYCCVILDSFENRIAPLSIRLMEVVFKRSETELQEILLNDYIDFSRCFEIKIYPSSTMTFDMSRDIISARMVDFLNMRVINWKAPSAKVDKSKLYSEKHPGVGIKQLIFRHSELSLSELPKSLEKLKLDMNTYNTINCAPIDLPNLECLYFQPAFNDTTANMSPTAYDMGIITSMFRLCPKLVDMELSGSCISDRRCDINVDLLPVNLKRIKLTWNKNINLVGETVIHVDILILDRRGTFSDAQKFMTNIKPKIVVVHLQGRWRGGLEFPADDIVTFIEESRKFEKVVIKVPDGGELRLRRYYWGIISRYVEKNDIDDAESNCYEPNCYEFTNQVGKRVTTEEFKLYWF